MKTKYMIIGLFLIALAIYLNRAYSHIYSAIDKAHLTSPDNLGTYVIGDNNSPAKLTYVALGDSLTAGVGVGQYQESYPYLLAQNLAEKQTTVTLKDLAVPGFKIKNLTDNLLAPAIAAKPDIITLLIGVNDIHGHVSLTVFQKYYQHILEELTKKTDAKIYVIGLPQIGSNQLLLPPYNYYFRWQTKRFNKVIKQLAEQFNLIYIDLDASTGKALQNNKAYYSADFFHPSATGYKLWAQTIYVYFHQ